MVEANPVKPQTYPGPVCPTCGNSFWFDYDSAVYCSSCGEIGVHIHKRAS